MWRTAGVSNRFRSRARHEVLTWQRQNGDKCPVASAGYLCRSYPYRQVRVASLRTFLRGDLALQFWGRTVGVGVGMEGDYCLTAGSTTAGAVSGAISLPPNLHSNHAHSFHPILTAVPAGLRRS